MNSAFASVSLALVPVLVGDGALEVRVLPHDRRVIPKVVAEAKFEPQTKRCSAS